MKNLLFTSLLFLYFCNVQAQMDDKFYYLKKQKPSASIPVLFRHSKTDKDVPFSQRETVYNNTKSKKELWIYEGEHLKAPQLLPTIFIQKVNALLQ